MSINYCIFDNFKTNQLLHNLLFIKCICFFSVSSISKSYVQGVWPLVLQKKIPDFIVNVLLSLFSRQLNSRLKIHQHKSNEKIL